jgi:hypothetical protein
LASINKDDRKALLAQAKKTAITSISGAYKPIFFEHGPAEVGMALGCGVDHAHLHSVPLAFDLLATLNTDMGWRKVDPDDPWETLRGGDYLLAGYGEKWIACEPKVAESQFFRRRIADAETGGFGWDHNEEPWADNVRRTIEEFTGR